jgi:hypothetical protein
MARNEAFLIRLTPGEKQAFKEAADVAGISLSAWVRERLRHSAIRELEAASKPIAFLQAPGGKGNVRPK